MRSRLAVVVVLVVAATAPAAADSSGIPGSRPAWDRIHQSSQAALAAAARLVVDTGEPPAPRIHVDEVVGTDATPRLILVGFTGGVERHDSAVSGVVRLREAVSTSAAAIDVRALTYNNFRWRRAASEVVALARAETAAAPGEAPPLPQPFIIVYGHSWGGGSIAKFARALRDEGLDISLAVYIDAFTVRNPRVPDNVHYAVNFYQRAGLLRGLPLRGKRQLLPDSPEATHILGSYRLRPDTDHFGWNWNLVQPLLYRHHHRISHDVRLQRYLVEVIGVLLEAVADAGPGAAPLAAAAGT